MRRFHFHRSLLAVVIATAVTGTSDGAPPDYSAVAALFDEHCTDCHADPGDADGKLLLTSHTALMQGGESGPAVLQGKAQDSLLVRLLEGRMAEPGRKSVMPPGKRAKLSADEITLVRAWIDAGAHPPALAEKPRELKVPVIKPGAEVRAPVTAMAAGPEFIAIARGGAVELRRAAGRKFVRKITLEKSTVSALAFSPDGRSLYAGSGQHGLNGEVRRWNAESGEQTAHYPGHTDGVSALALSGDGNTMASGGYDQRIIIWNTKTGDAVRTLKGHNGAVLSLAFRPDGRILASASADRTIKLWDPVTGERRDTLSQPLKEQCAVLWNRDGSRLYAAGADSRLRVWQITPDARETTNPLLETAFVHEGPVLTLTSSADGQTLATTGGDGAVKLWRADSLQLVRALEKQPDWPQTAAFTADSITVGRANGSVASYQLSDGQRVKPRLDELPEHSAAPGLVVPVTPATVKGAFTKPGEEHRFQFDVSAGALYVFDLRGGKAAVAFSLHDAAGRLLAAQPRRYQFTAAGRCEIRLAEKLLAASPEHTFTLTFGDFPLVTGVTPLVVPAGAKSEITLLGESVPSGARMTVDAIKPGDLAVTPDPARFRAARPLNVLVEAQPPLARADGVLTAPGAACELRFKARAGQPVVVETMAARRGSPADTRLEILTANGKPVPQARLQATKATAQAFRGIGSTQDTDFRVDQWEEMELRQFLYCSGEVVRLFRAPQGPDSGFAVFPARNGQRRGYFHTSGQSHALDEPYYIVHPLSDSEPPLANGLPVFTVFGENDDDAERELGSDSRLLFTPPQDGEFLARVRESRGLSGPDFAVHVRVRNAQPGFDVSIDGAAPEVSPGTGTTFVVALDRHDGFDGDVRVEFSNVPQGFHITSPIVVENDHLTAAGTLWCDENAPPPDPAKPITLKACAGSLCKESAAFGVPKPKAGKSAAFTLALEPAEITIAPGTLTTAKLKVSRRGYDGLFNLEVLGLPHGVIVNNIGLNGVQVAAGESEREIEFACERWVPETQTAAFPANKGGHGQQSGPPVAFRVRRAAP